MTPSDYMNRYLHCPLWLMDDSVAEVSIDKYMNAGTSGRFRAAWQEYERLINALARRTRTRAWAPYYEIDGWVFLAPRLRRAFNGKGSPAEIQDACLAASYCGRLAADKPQRYADDYLGTDCNGFVGNYFAIDPNTGISVYDRRRRRDVSEIRPRDVVIFVDSSGAHKHIALVHSIEAGPAAVNLTLVHSRGEQAGGVQSESLSKSFRSDRQGAVYFEGPLGRHGYIAPPPASGPPKE